MFHVNRLYDLWGHLEAGRPQRSTQSFPQVNVWEKDEAYHVEAELPGLTADQLAVVVAHRCQVMISGERKPVEHEGSWHRRERLGGKFERVLTFARPIDADKVEARLEHGVLHLTLPKAEEARPRKIPVTKLS